MLFFELSIILQYMQRQMEFTINSKGVLSLEKFSKHLILSKTLVNCTKELILKQCPIAQSFFGAQTLGLFFNFYFKINP